MALRATHPDVVHVLGLTMDLHLATIVRLVRAPVVAHFHGGLPATGRLRLVQRHIFTRLTSAPFTTWEQADPWMASSVVSLSEVEEVLETSSPLNGTTKTDARAMTSMTGVPIYLSVGRLHLIKDPLTMLRGFADIASHQSGARLYLHYLTDELLPEIHAVLDANPILSNRVELRGSAEPEAIEAIYTSADFLLQASLREWSGLAILEAMSCGCIPIVTDIPSFAKMTENGRYGRLFPVGDAHAPTSAARGVRVSQHEGVAWDVQAHFRASLSFAAIGRRLDTIYHGIVAM